MYNTSIIYNTIMYNTSIMYCKWKLQAHNKVSYSIQLVNDKHFNQKILKLKIAYKIHSTTYIHPHHLFSYIHPHHLFSFIKWIVYSAFHHNTRKLNGKSFILIIISVTLKRSELMTGLLRWCLFQFNSFNVQNSNSI